MALPPPILLTAREKDRLLIQQQEMIERLVTRITELEALVGQATQDIEQFACPTVERWDRFRQEAPEAIDAEPSTPGRESEAAGGGA